MKIILAGSDTRGSEEQCLKHDAPKLYSFLNEKKQIERWNDDYFLMVDSGAHSWNKETITKIGLQRETKIKPAEDFIEVYFEFIKQYKDKKVIWVEFDVYGHLPIEQIDNFYERIINLGIAGKFMRVYHPMLDNGDLSVLKKWISQGQEYIGIGNDSTYLLDEIFSLTKNKTKIHGFAMTKLNLIEKYPFFSADSTTPLSTVIFGKYSTPIMSYLEKEHIMKMKSVECYQDDGERLEKAIIEMKQTEIYITELWKKKGVIWEDLKY